MSWHEYWKSSGSLNIKEVKLKALEYVKIVILIIAGTTVACTNTNLTESGPGNTSNMEESLLYSDMSIEVQSFPNQELSNEEIEGLYFLREEEKLARDVYLKFYEIYGLRVFQNIAESEQRHTDAVKNLINKYELEDPVEEDIPGSFKNEELQNLYNSLIETGQVSLVEALKVGVAIEEIDILDLQKQLEEVVDNEDIIFVYSNLKRGSENHLQAFTRNLSRRG
jgi:hypothetical protein